MDSRSDAERPASAAADLLTPRERECLTLVLEPLDNKEIAAALGIAPNTVANHIKSAKQKLGVSTKRQAARVMRDAHGLKSASPASAIPPAPALPPLTALPDQRPVDANYLREAQMPFDAGVSFDRPATGIIDVEDAYSGRSIGHRLALTLVVTVGMALAFGGLLGGLDSLSRLFRP